ncbi:MAG: hypothetical protein Q7T03_03230 [Deltaproteobacteria bacterium]|nr:hypothetical protein [Deltaproteobacteria bacterium]
MPPGSFGGEYTGGNGYRGWSQIYLDGKRAERQWRIEQHNRGNDGCGSGPKSGGGSGAVAASAITAMLLGASLFISRWTMAGLALSLMPNISEKDNLQNEI